jgi:hypothetical protein
MLAASAASLPNHPNPAASDSSVDLPWTEDDSSSEPPIVRGLHVIGEIANDGKSTGTFDVIGFDDRTWVAACSANPFPCARPQIQELTGSSWAPPNVGLAGLPTLGSVNLYGLPDLPFKRWVTHEANAPFDSPRDECLYSRFMLGSRYIAEAKGKFPDNAWLVLRASLSHSGLPTDDLYHWSEGQWRLVLHATEYAFTIFDAAPFDGGIAIARRRGNWSEFRFDLIYITDSYQRELLQVQSDDVLLANKEDALIALVGTQSKDQATPASKVNVFRWNDPFSEPESLSIPVDAATYPTPLAVQWEPQLQLSWSGDSDANARTTKVKVNLEGKLTYTTHSFIGVYRTENGSRIELPLPYHGEAYPDEQWQIHGRHFWSVRVEQPQSKVLLLSDQPATKWTSKGFDIPAPTVAECDRLPLRGRRRNSK